MIDSPVARDPYTRQPAEQRIIGIELRLITNGYEVEEIALVPCDVRIPADYNAATIREINATIHTSRGDTNFAGNARLLPG